MFKYLIVPIGRTLICYLILVAFVLRMPQPYVEYFLLTLPSDLNGGFILLRYS